MWKVDYKDSSITIHFYNKPKTTKISKFLVQGGNQMMKHLFVFDELPAIYKHVCTKITKLEIKVKTEDTHFTCNQCKVKSKTLADLRKHTKTKHKKQQKSLIQPGEMLSVIRKSVKRIPQFTPITKPLKKCKPDLPISFEIFEENPNEASNPLKILDENISISDISMNDTSAREHRNDNKTEDTANIGEQNSEQHNTSRVGLILETERREKVFYCTLCGESFHEETQLDDHRGIPLITVPLSPGHAKI